MIKASLPMLLPVYHKLFNYTILSLGTVPNIWCNFIITPTFKERETIRRITAEFVFQAVWESYSFQF